MKQTKIPKTKITVTSVLGNSQKLDGGAMFGNAPKAMWQRWIKPDEQNRIPLACRSMLIEINGKKILCEVGVGAFFEPKKAERFGIQDSTEHLLIKNLNAIGIDESDIDYVLLSHLHFDHAGGLLPSYEEIQDGNDQLLFPNAKYIVGKESFARSDNPHSRDRASFMPGFADKLKASNRLILIDENQPITHPDLIKDFDNRLSFFISHGHTPGQLLAIFQGNQKKFMFCGDLIPGTHWIHMPITMGYDRLAELVIDEKQKLYHEVISDDWMFFYTHDPVFACSEIRKNEKGKFEGFNKFEILNSKEF